MLDGSRYTVRFVDYGHEEVLVSDNLLPLPAMFALDPPYAVACSLHGIKPAAGKLLAVARLPVLHYTFLQSTSMHIMDVM